MSAKKSDPAARGGSQPGAASPTPEPFDTRLERLEALVTELEGGDLGLEAAIDRYREGVALLRGCRDTLATFQRQVEELAQEPGGGARPYTGDPDVDGAQGRGGSDA